MFEWRLNPYVLVIAVVSIIAAAMAGLSFLLVPRTDEIVRMMSRRMSRIDTFRVEAELRYVAKNDAASAKVRADIDRTDRDAATQRFVFDLKKSGEVRSETWAGTAISRGREWRVRLDETPASVADFDLSPYGRVWLVFAPDQIRAKLATAIVREPDHGPTPADRKVLEAYARETPFFSLRERLEDGQVRGIPVYRLRVAIEPLFFREFAAKSESARIGRPLTAEERAELDRFFSGLSFADTDLLIGKKDFLLYQLKSKCTRTVDDGVAALEAIFRFSQFNVPLAISWPDEVGKNAAAALDAIFTKKFTAGLQSAAAAEVLIPSIAPRVQSDLSADDPDGDGLANELEVFYRTDPRKADSDGDGVNDGAEVNAGTNPTGPGKIFDFGLGGN